MINGKPSLGCSQIPPLEMFSYVLIDTSAGGLLVHTGIIHPVVSASTLTWFIIYIYITEIYSS